MSVQVQVLLLRQLGAIMQMDRVPQLFHLPTATTAFMPTVAMRILVMDIQVTTTAVTMDRRLIGTAISRATHNPTQV